MFACLYGNGNLAALAGEFSPLVEVAGTDTVTFDAGGLDRLFGLPQDVAAAIMRRAGETGIQASLALAANPDAAICAARGFPGVSIVPYGDEAKFLASLPLTQLSPPPELLETLHRWGIRNFGQLAALPPLGIAERLGREGLHLRELARGEVTRKLVPVEQPPRYEDACDLEYPVELLEPLLFVLARLLNGVCTRLATRGLATDELRLCLQLEGAPPHQRTLRLPVPALDPKAFLKLLQLDLAAHPPAAPVVHLHLTLHPAKPRAAQSGLFVPATPEPVKLELTLARLQALVGGGNVGTPQLLDTHRPDAFRMVRFTPVGGEPSAVPAATRLAIRMFRPPKPARVALTDGQPGQLQAEGIRGRITSVAGPWRTSGDWWSANPWSRDEWDIALSNGALYRIYCDPRGWFVEGTYD